MPHGSPVFLHVGTAPGGAYDAESLADEQAPYLSHARDLRITVEPLQPPTSSQLNVGAALESYQKLGTLTLPTCHWYCILMGRPWSALSGSKGAVGQLYTHVIVGDCDVVPVVFVDVVTMPRTAVCVGAYGG